LADAQALGAEILGFDLDFLALGGGHRQVSSTFGNQVDVADGGLIDLALQALAQGFETLDEVVAGLFVDVVGFRLHGDGPEFQNRFADALGCGDGAGERRIGDSQAVFRRPNAGDVAEVRFDWIKSGPARRGLLVGEPGAVFGLQEIAANDPAAGVQALQANQTGIADQAHHCTAPSHATARVTRVTVESPPNHVPGTRKHRVRGYFHDRRSAIRYVSILHRKELEGAKLS